MLMGEFYYNLDTKGRLSIPSKFRQILEEKGESNLVITRGLDKCLFIFPGYEWPSWEKKIRALPFNKSKTRAFTRIMLGSASDVVMTKHGRILIPYSLRKHAEIDKEVVIIGLSNRIEVWDKKRWEEYQSQNEENLEEISEELDDFDIL